MTTTISSRRVTLAYTMLLLLALALIPPTLSPESFIVGAVVFQVGLYNEDGEPLSTDILGKNFMPRSVEVIAQIYAITPPGDPAVLREVYRGKIDGLILRLEASGLLREVAEKWVEFEKRRGPPTRDSETAVQVNLWIIDKANCNILQRVSYYYTYSPKGLLEGEERVYKIKVAVPRGGEQVGRQVDRGIGTCSISPWWKPKYIIVPENYTQAYGEHIMYRDGTWYVRTPLLTIQSTRLNASTLVSDIVIGYIVGFHVAQVMGFEIEAKLKNGNNTDWLDGKVYLAGMSRREKVSFGNILHLDRRPGEVYSWIWTRPIMILYDEYMSDNEGSRRTGYQKIEFFIQDYAKWYDDQINKYQLEGGVRKEPLPSFMREWLLNDTLSEWRLVYTLYPDSPYDFITFDILAHMKYVDACNADFELPLGALLTPVVVGDPRISHLAPLTVLVTPSLSIDEPVKLSVSIGLMNHGPYVEHVYLRFSKVSYRKDPPWWCLWCSPCYYEVPVAMYFRSG